MMVLTNDNATHSLIIRSRKSGC